MHAHSRFRLHELAAGIALAFPFGAILADTPCTVSGAVVTCQGSQSAGIDLSAPPSTLIVFGLSDPIRPSSGKPGIRLGTSAGYDLTINSGSAAGKVVITTTQAPGIVASSQGAPPPPANDPLLGVPIPGDPKVPGGVVRIESYSDIGTSGTGAHGIVAQSSTAGYPDSVIAALEGFTDAGISFKVTSITKPLDGSSGTLDAPVKASIALIQTGAGGLDTFSGYAGEAGSFTIAGDGAVSFDPGTDFDDLALGQSRTVSVKVAVDGYRDNALKRTGEKGELIARVTRNQTTGLLEIVTSVHFDTFGDSDRPLTEGKAWPDLNSYVDGLVASAQGAGGAGNSVSVTHRAGAIRTAGAASFGVFAQSAGKAGAGGRNGGGFFSFGTQEPSQGGAGNVGGAVTVQVDGSISTEFQGASDQLDQASVGVFAHSSGGNGGRGGNGGTYYYGRRGGTGGDGGLVVVSGSATINTLGNYASGILALSEGGDGGNGGDGADVTGGGAGGFGGKGGPVQVDGTWTITTRGNSAHGIWAKSVGGNAGTGGSGGWLAGAPAPGGQATDGGSVTLISGGAVATWGGAAYGLFGQSVGGFGGSGGSGGSIFYSRGGNGNSAGSGGAVSVTNLLGGEVVTHGEGSHAMFAQSVGGGGGAGGGAAAIVGVGGSGAAGGFGGAVEAVNAGRIQTFGKDARGIYAQSIGGGGGDGGSSAGLVAVGGGGSGTSDGGNVTIINSGVIETQGIGANTVFAQSIGGGGGAGGSSAGWFSIGGSGGGGGNAGKVAVTNTGAKLETTAADATAIYAQSVGGGGGKGGNSAAVGAFVSLAIGGKGAAGGAGSDVTVNNTGGEIRTAGDRSFGIYAQSIGGGGGDGGFAFSASGGIGGSLAVSVGGAGGGGGNAGTVYLVNDSHITTTGNEANAIFAESIGGGGGTGGFAISGAGSDGVGVAMAFGGTGGLGGDAKAVTVLSDGTISTCGKSSIGLQAQSVGGGGGNGGFSVAGSGGGLGAFSLGVGGKAGGGGMADSVRVESDGSIQTLGADAFGLFAQSVGGGGGNGGFTVAAAGAGIGAGAIGIGGAGGDGGTSKDVTVLSRGAITTAGESAVGLFAQSVGGGGGNGGFAVSGAGAGTGAGTFNLGGTAGGGGASDTVSVTSEGRITTLGDKAHGLLAQSVGGGGGNGGFSITGSGAGVGSGSISIGGLGGDGGNSKGVTVISRGDIDTSGAAAVGLFAQSVGGGGGSGGFSISGSGAGTGAGTFNLGGAGGGGGDADLVTVDSHGAIHTRGEDGYGLLAQSVGGGGGNGGFSVTGSGAGTGAGSIGIGGFGGDGGAGKGVSVSNAGGIDTEGNRAVGLFAQSVGGGGGSGGFSIAGSGAGTGAGTFSLGGRGGSGGSADLVTANNAGRLVTLGDYSYGLLAQSVGGGGGNGGFSITGSGAGTGAGSLGIGGFAGGGGHGKAVMVTNSGDTYTYGAGAAGLLAQSVGGGGGTGGFSIVGSGAKTGAATFSLGGKGGLGGNGDSVTLTNSGLVNTYGTLAYGVLAQSVGGGGGTGGFSFAGGVTTDGAGLNASVGGFGGAGGDGGSVGLANRGAVSTASQGAHAIVAQSIGGGGGSGGFGGSLTAGLNSKANISISVGGSGGVAGDGNGVDLDNSAALSTAGAAAYGLFAQSVGGAGGDGGGSLAIAMGKHDGGANLAFSLGGMGNAAGQASLVEVHNAGLIETSGSKSHAIVAQSVGGGGGTGGFSATGVMAKGTNTKDLSVGIGGSGGAGGDGGLVVVTNEGEITVTGSGAGGIVAQSLGGGGGNGGFSFAGSFTGAQAKNLAISIGGSGGAGGKGQTVTVTNAGAIETGLAATVQATLQPATASAGQALAAIAALPLPPAPPVPPPPDPADALLIDRLANVTSHGILAQSIGGGGGNGGTSISLGSSFSGGKGTWNVNGTVAVGGAGGSGNVGGAVGVTNHNAVTTWSGGSHAIFAQSVGGGGGQGGSSLNLSLDVDQNAKNNTLTASLSIGGAGGSGNLGGNVSVNNESPIATFGDISHGIYAQSIGGGGGDGGSPQAISLATSDLTPWKETDGNNWSAELNVGGNGGDANKGGTASVVNRANISTSGALARGIFAQSVGGGGGSVADGVLGKAGDWVDAAQNVIGAADLAFAIKDLFKKKPDASALIPSGVSLTVGSNGGDSGDADAVSVDSRGDISTRGLGAHAIYAQSVGGGGGEAQLYAKGEGAGESAEVGIGTVGEFAIGGAGGAAGQGSSVTVKHDGALTTRGEAAHGIFAQSIGGGGGQAGSIAGGFSGLGSIGLGLAFGRDGGSAGNAGAVTVNSRGTIVTQGASSLGIFAQSVGGGGGVLGDVGGIAFAGSVGGQGSGGNVEVGHTGDVRTTGAMAHGLFAQSAGGMSSSGGALSYLGLGGRVTVRLDGTISADGADADGIVAQSIGVQGAGDVRIDVASGAVRGGSAAGVGVRILDGANNALTNRGTISALSGNAIVGGIGHETVDNHGTIVGSVDLGAGSNTFNNLTGSVFESAATVKLGVGRAFNNAGTLSPGGAGRLQVTTLAADYQQAPGGALAIDVNLATVASDRIEASGSARVGGEIRVNSVDSGRAMPGDRQLVALSAAGGVTDDGLSLVAPASSVARYELSYPSANEVAIRSTLDFAPRALGANAGRIGEHVNAIQSAGGSDSFAPYASSLVAQPDDASLAQAYEKLGPGALGSLPTGAVTASVNFNDALHSCRVRDGDYRFVHEGECNWVRLEASVRDQERSALNPGYRLDTVTVAGGGQRALAPDTQLGLGLSYQRSDLESGLSTVQGDQFEAGLILKRRYGATVISGSASLGYGLYDSRRQVDLATPGVTASAEQKIRLLAVHGRVSHEIERSKSFFLRPLVDLGISHVSRGGFTETGAGGANLVVAKEADTFATLQPAIEFGGEAELDGGWLLRPHLRVGLTQYLTSNDRQITASLQGAPGSVAPFTVVTGADRTHGDLSLGVDLLKKDGHVLRIDYTGQFSGKSSSNALGLKVSMPF